MSHLTIESGQEIVRKNLQTLYHLPKSYEAIHHYLDTGTLKQTLYKILNHIKDKQIIIDKHRYEFLLDTKQLTYRVRRKVGSDGTSNRHFNLLCCMGLINRIYQSPNKNILLDANREFLKKSQYSRPINVFSFREYTEKELQRIEERSERLMAAGVTIGCISANYLSLNGCTDIANEVYFSNDRTAQERKLAEAGDLLSVMELLTDRDCYTTRETVKENLVIDDKELDRVFRIFKSQIEELYTYKPPTKEQIQRWNLKNRKYVYIRREKQDADRSTE